MIYTVHITEQTENDLRGIYEYIAFEKNLRKMQAIKLTDLKKA